MLKLEKVQKFLWKYDYSIKQITIFFIFMALICSIINAICLDVEVLLIIINASIVLLYGISNWSFPWYLKQLTNDEVFYIVKNSEPSDWTTVHPIDDNRVIEKIYHQNSEIKLSLKSTEDTFNESWAVFNKLPAYKAYCSICYKQQVLDHKLLLHVDDARALLPMTKEIDSQEFDEVSYKIAKIYNIQNMFDRYIDMAKNKLSRLSNN